MTTPAPGTRQLRRIYRNQTVHMKLREASRLAPPVTVPAAWRGYCGHVETICLNCADEWENDYEIWWPNTPASQSLKRMLDASRVKR